MSASFIWTSNFMEIISHSKPPWCVHRYALDSIQGTASIELKLGWPCPTLSISGWKPGGTKCLCNLICEIGSEMRSHSPEFSIEAWPFKVTLRERWMSLYSTNSPSARNSGDQSVLEWAWNTKQVVTSSLIFWGRTLMGLGYDRIEQVKDEAI